MYLVAALLTAVVAQANPAPPAVSTGAADSITTSGATVTGTVDPGGAATTYQVEYGTSSSYGLTTAAADAGSGTDPVAARDARGTDGGRRTTTGSSPPTRPAPTAGPTAASAERHHPRALGHIGRGERHRPARRDAALT
jgi:hypothetical protein